MSSKLDGDAKGGGEEAKVFNKAPREAGASNVPCDDYEAQAWQGNINWSGPSWSQRYHHLAGLRGGTRCQGDHSRRNVHRHSVATSGLGCAEVKNARATAGVPMIHDYSISTGELGCEEVAGWQGDRRDVR